MGNKLFRQKLSKEDLELLIKHTHYDETDIKLWYKGFQRNCPSGKMTLDDFKEMYDMFFPSGHSEEFWEHVFRAYDTDGNGYIDFKEFLLAIDVTSTGTLEEKIKWAFRIYDVDANGVIDQQEMIKIVQAITDMFGKIANESGKSEDSVEAVAKTIFQKMDENNDGILSQDEFLKGCLQDKKLGQMLTTTY